MHTYPDISRFWKSSRALDKARAEGLRIARAILEKRQSQDLFHPQISKELHLGHEHLNHFKQHLLPIIKKKHDGCRVVEVGAGMGLHAVLMAAYGVQDIIATELSWTERTPYCNANIHTLYRLAIEDKPLESVVDFERNEKAELYHVSFPPSVKFVCADGCRLPLKDSSVDFLYSIDCIEHIKEFPAMFSEAERVLHEGGLFYAATQPLFYSVFGHHLADILPVPWGHLLWEPDELIDIVLRETPEREVEPGVPLEKHHLESILHENLSYAAPRDIRHVLLREAWRVKEWYDIVHPGDARLAKEMGLMDALKSIKREALFLVGLHFLLERASVHQGIRLPLRVSYRTRRSLRPLINVAKWVVGERKKDNSF